jgi:hypothetical protein
VVFSEVSDALKWTIWGDAMWSLHLSSDRAWAALTNMRVRDYLFFIEHFWSLLFDNPEKVFAAALTVPDLLGPSSESRFAWNQKKLKIDALVLQNKLQVPTPVEWKTQQVSTYALSPAIPEGSGRFPIAILPSNVRICILQLSHDGKYLAATDSHNMVCFYRALDGKLLQSVQTTYLKITSICWVGSAHFCLGVSRDGIVVWKLPADLEDKVGEYRPHIVYSSTLYCPPKHQKSTITIENDM